MTGSVAGIDWASEKHVVLIANAAGERCWPNVHARRAARVVLANQLRAELERFWSGPIGLFAADLPGVPGPATQPG